MSIHDVSGVVGWCLGAYSEVENKYVTIFTPFFTLGPASTDRQTDSFNWDTNPHTPRLYCKPTPPLPLPRHNDLLGLHIGSSRVWKKYYASHPLSPGDLLRLSCSVPPKHSIKPSSECMQAMLSAIARAVQYARYEL